MLVSILIPCYNAERWIAQAIESALAQTWPEKEVIVVDDGSTDRSLEEIKRFNGRVQWETGPNRGGNVARNRLLELANGEWLQYLDADDYLLPEKISNQMRFLSSHPTTDLVFGPLIVEYQRAGETKNDLHTIQGPLDDPWILLARWHLPQTGSSLWRKQAIVKVGGWEPDQNCCQEHELYLRMLSAGMQFRHCPDNGTIYRQWGKESVSTRDRSKLHRRRLEIEEKAEDFLRTAHMLTTERQWAINQGRFDVARAVQQYDPEFASKIVGTIRQSQPDFVPSGGGARLGYRLVYRTLGFRIAERVADWKRRRIQT